MNSMGYFDAYCQSYFLPICPQPSQHNIIRALPFCHFPVMDNHYVPVLPMMTPLINVGYSWPGPYIIRSLPVHVPVRNAVLAIGGHQQSRQAAPQLQCSCLSRRSSQHLPLYPRGVYVAHSSAVNHPARQRARTPGSFNSRQNVVMPLTCRNLKRWEQEHHGQSGRIFSLPTTTPPVCPPKAKK